MEPWNWHPIFVHFTVALLFTASVLFIVSAIYRQRPWSPRALNAAYWIFWLGILAALVTAVTGLIAYFTVPSVGTGIRHEINEHLLSAVITATIYLILAYFLWRRQRQQLAPSGGWTACLIIAIISLLTTGYLGGQLVFDYGVGVNAVETGTKPS